MNCPKCGAVISGDTKFCTACGFALAQVPPPRQPVQPQPVYAAQQPQFQPAYAGTPPYAPVKKKKHIGLWITIAILLSIIVLIGWFVNSLLFSPKNLGVKYTQADYDSAIEKTGIQTTFDGMSGDELDQYIDSLNGQKLNIDDYNWEFTDYQQKSFTLTPSEASALLNGIAPAFWWFDNVQVNVLPDGTMEGSSTLDVKSIMNDLYSDVADQIPISLPQKVNIYSRGAISITDNKLTCDPQTFNIGPIALPEEYMTEESVNVISEYMERIYTIIPDMEINSLTTDTNGNIIFDGVIPQSITVTPKS